MTTRSLEWAVTTWNLQGSKSTDVARMAEVIAEQSSDVIAVQEIRRSQARRLAERLGMQMTWAFKHWALTPLLNDRAEGAAILTPHELSDSGHQTVSEVRSRRSYRRRIVQWATISRPDHSGYRLYNAHLSPHARSELRILEARRIAELARSHGTAPPTIVAGDLNNHGEPAVTAALPGVEHLTPPPTNPSERPDQRLDHVLLPADARAVSVSVPAGGEDWQRLSDHLPVTVRFSLDWVAGDFT